MTTTAPDTATPTTERTADELGAKLAQLDAEMRTLATKRETLSERAAERTAAAAAVRREIMQAQLADTPDEKSMRAARTQLLDYEADASTASSAAGAIARTIAELARERRETIGRLILAEYRAAERAMVEANDALAAAMAQVPDLVEEPLRALKQAVDACAAAGVRAWNDLAGYDDARREAPHPDMEVPYLWRRTFWQEAETILAAAAACRTDRRTGT